MNNKKLMTFLIIGLVILVGVGIFVLSSNKKTIPEQVEQVPVEEQISKIKPEDIGLVLSVTSDKRKVIFEVANTEGIAGLDYQLSYTSKGDIPRGAIGNIDIKISCKPITQEIPLGTCSDVCHYDEDVSNIKLILKVAKTDGIISQVEKSLEL